MNEVMPKMPPQLPEVINRIREMALMSRDYQGHLKEKINVLMPFENVKENGGQETPKRDESNVVGTLWAIADLLEQSNAIASCNYSHLVDVVG